MKTKLKIGDLLIVPGRGTHGLITKIFTRQSESVPFPIETICSLNYGGKVTEWKLQELENFIEDGLLAVFKKENHNVSQSS